MDNYITPNLIWTFLILTQWFIYSFLLNIILFMLIALFSNNVNLLLIFYIQISSITLNFKLEHHHLTCLFLIFSIFPLLVALLLLFFLLLIHFLDWYYSSQLKPHSFANLFTLNESCPQSLLLWIFLNLWLPLKRLNCDETVAGSQHLISHSAHPIKFLQLYCDLMGYNECCNL